MENYDIVTIGGAVRDIIFYTEEGKIFKNPHDNPLVQKIIGFEAGAKIYIKDVSFLAGGGALNTGVGFSKLGIKTGAITRVGNDQAGKDLIKKMKSRNLDTKFFQIDQRHSTAFSFIPTLKKEKAHSIFTYHGAIDYLKIPDDLNKKLKTNWFYISSLSSPKWPSILEKVFKFKSKNNIKIAWNPSSVQIKANFKKIKPFLKDLDVIILNQDEAKELVSKIKNITDFTIKKILKEIYNMGPRLVVITCGKKGALCFNGEKTFTQKTKKVNVLNTTGAGDAFSSGFIASLFLKPDDFQRALVWGVLNSSAVIQLNGAQKGLLNKKEIQNIKIN